MSQQKSCHELKSTQRVLAFVNRIRTEKLGLKPLKRLKPGRTMTPRSCSIANSLSTPGRFKARVSGEIVVNDGKTQQRHEIATPSYVDAWINRFDDGRYPDLVVSG